MIMSQTDSLVQRLFPGSNDELMLGDHTVSQIVEQYGTPLFVYVRDIAEKNLALIRKTLPDGFSVFYSVKANPSRELLRFFLRNGCGLEIASGGELCQALAAGASPEKIIYAGPSKSEKELDLALTTNIGEIHVESFVELERLTRICVQKDMRAPISLRINPTPDAQGGAMQMGGKASPFGIDEEYLETALRKVMTQPYLDLRGVHLYSGTQILDYKIIVAQYRKGLEIGRRAAEILGRPLGSIDFGGGYGIPYFANDQALDMEKLRQELAILFHTHTQSSAFRGTRFIVEPGRYLIGESGIYITAVNDIKDSRGKRFVLVDGGMHHHLAASGNLGQTIKRNFPIAALTKLNARQFSTVDIVGPLCTPLDTLGRSVDFPDVEIGDLIGIFQSGAYARTASPLGFLSHCAPPEIWIEGDKHTLIRRRSKYEDMLQDFNNGRHGP